MIKPVFAIMMALTLAIFGASGREYVNIDSTDAAEIVRANSDGLADMRARFLAGDTTLTVDQVAKVYFAAPLHEGYVAAGELTALDDAFGAEDYITALPLAMKALENDPTSLDATVKAIVSIKLSGARLPDLLRMLVNRYDMLSMALLSTGGGVTLESPFVVRSKADQYRLLTNVFQVEKIVGFCDIAGCNAAKVILPDSGGRESILYFRITD